MRTVTAMLACFLCLVGFAKAGGETLPDLLFREGGGFGGFGRLAHDAEANRYRLVDGRVHAYVVDGNLIRLMRPDEGGGTMGNPQRVVALDGRLFGANAYSRIHEFDAVTGAVLKDYPLGVFRYGGGAQPALYASDRSLLVLDGQRVLTLGSRLQRLGEQQFSEALGQRGGTGSLAQVGAQLHGLMVVNPRAASDCAGGCNLVVFIRHTIVDFSEPSHIRISSRQETLHDELHLSHQAVDVGRGGWLLARHDFKQDVLTLEWRSFGQLAKASARLRFEAGTRIEAATDAAPFWFVLSTKGGGHHLARVQVNGGVLALRKYPLGWLTGSAFTFGMAADQDERVYVAANHQLAVYETQGGEPRLRLQQNFVSAADGASQLQIRSVMPVQLAPARVSVDRGRLKAILGKSYWSEADQIALDSEILKLTAADTWAIAMFTELARTRTHAYRGGAHHAARALEKFGPAAIDAVPALVAATMEGGSIRSDVLAAVIPAIRAIDPRGEAVRRLLPECIRESYVCEHVGKEILRGLRD